MRNGGIVALLAEQPDLIMLSGGSVVRRMNRARLQNPLEHHATKPENTLWNLQHERFVVDLNFRIFEHKVTRE